MTFLTSLGRDKLLDMDVRIKMKSQTYNIAATRKFEFYHELYIESMLAKFYERVYFAVITLQLILGIVIIFIGHQSGAAGILLLALVTVMMVVNPQRRSLKARRREAQYVDMIALIDTYSDDELSAHICAITRDNACGRGLVEKAAYLQAAHYFGAMELAADVKRQLGCTDKLVASLAGGLPL
ncbi:hypothetical protein [Serratia rubidaea]|uniref:hypothetical protein n=1 Tax=Serratia rubidaea TaxID=61652 RepID=UPI003FA36A60